ncbi:LVIVD repeat-containing protein [Flavobacterium sp. A45]|uniref:LVIVD repeat-containing protein n=1 Tax=Flavobacterium sp. A45 TaxID=1945862 RepID=UPI000986965F|nr:PQQ-binding-like beta-propeller repeat protein [Flavobacterium sp. A45]OOG65882.1 hypothetical protein B0E44_15210 [Flavobacterium sp. A45]
MKKRIFLFSILTLAFITSCSDQEDSNTETISSDKNAIVINDNQTQLNQRLDLSNSGVISIINPSTRKGLATESAQLPLTQIAEFNAPKDSNGRTLQANHVAVNGNYAYVAYTLQGNEYSGAIDMIDVSDPYKPKLVMSALIPDTDITSLVYTNNKLIIAGATNADKNPALLSPAIVMNMQLTSSGALTTSYTTNDIASFVTTDVAANNNNYFAVSGNTGSLFKFDNSTKEVVSSKAIEDLRAIAISNDKVVTLSGTKGINIYNASNLELTKSFSSWRDDVQDAKRTIDFIGDKVLVSEGYQGLGVYNMSTGTKIQTISLIPTATTEPEDVVTNAVSVNGDYVFVANGGNGLNVYKTGDQLTLVGTVGINGSSNYVKSSGDYIYVASGKGGLKIIKMEKPTPPTSNSCTGLPAFNLGNDLILNSNETKGFYGSTAINSIIINSNSVLTHCGSISIQNNLTVNSKGKFIMNGSLSQGKYQQANPTVLTVNSNATLQIEGSVVIWGDLTLNSNSNIEFIGSGSSITIYGKVNKSSNISITGNYTDTENKLK